MRTKSTQPILTTSPHGAQSVVEWRKESRGFPIHNKLFCIRDTDGRTLLMTGEELTSLSEQWLKFASKKGSK